MLVNQGKLVDAGWQDSGPGPGAGPIGVGNYYVVREVYWTTLTKSPLWGTIDPLENTPPLVNLLWDRSPPQVLFFSFFLPRRVLWVLWVLYFGTCLVFMRYLTPY